MKRVEGAPFLKGAKVFSTVRESCSPCVDVLRSFCGGTAFSYVVSWATKERYDQRGSVARYYETNPFSRRASLENLETFTSAAAGNRRLSLARQHGDVKALRTEQSDALRANVASTIP
jgi:hypothetical protein